VRSGEADKTQALAARNNLAVAHRDRFAETVNLEDFKEAEKQIQNVLAVDTSNKEAYENLARLYYDRGRLKDKSYLVLADLVITQALRVLDKEGSQSADIYNLRGLLLMQEDNQIDALKAFKKAVEVEPKHIDANLNIAFISIRFRDYAGAETALEIALKDPAQQRNIEPHIAMGVAKRGLKKFKEAEEQYLKAAKVDAKDSRPWYNLGVLAQDHLVGQEGVDSKKLEEYYNIAKKHYGKYLSMSESGKPDPTALKDAKDRIAIIDDAIASFRIMEQLEKKAAELAEKEKKANEAEQKRLLDLEKQAEAAASSAPPAAEPEPAKPK
jgi:tetratricopeptide (TPR) repeat protein